jgi:hypothetical protein
MAFSIAANRGPSATARSGATHRFGRPLVGGLALLLLVGMLGLVPVASASPVAACAAGQLSARIARWEGAAGSRIADVRIVNTSFGACVIRDLPRVQLVSARGLILIRGAAASTTAATHTVPALGFLRTEVATSNYCGRAYTGPVTLAFVLPGTLGRVVAMPVSATDTAGVPPCLGAPGSVGHISMHAWH